MNLEIASTIALVILAGWALVSGTFQAKQSVETKADEAEPNKARQLIMRRRAIVESEDKMSATMEHIKWLDSVRKYYKKSEKASE